jgi:hypothetical protein
MMAEHGAVRPAGDTGEREGQTERSWRREHDIVQRRLAAWSDAHLITPEQAERIAQHELSTRPSSIATATSRRLPAFVEGLGYIGGILTLVGAVLLVARYWDDMPLSGRLALGLGAAGVLLLAGLLTRESDPALVRLRWSLWTLSTAAAAITVAVGMNDAIDDVRGSAVALAVAAVVAMENGLLWRGRRRPIQQLLFLGSLPIVVGATAALASDGNSAAVGIAVASTGAVILAGGLSGRVGFAALTDAIGAVTTIIGAMLTIEQWKGPGYVLALVVVGAVLALALSPRLVLGPGEQLVIGVAAALALWQLVPASIVHFADEAGMATGLVMAAVGAAAIGLGHRRAVRLPILVLLVGGAALVGGLAITATQSVAFATIAGLVAALALIALGTRPGWAVVSIIGAAGLLVNVPWAIAWFFPGEGRAPLLIAVAGVIIIVAAVLLGRMRGRLRSEWDT